MIGKKNIVFGFLFLVLSAALGPYMVTQVFPEVGKAEQAKGELMAELALIADNDFEKDLEPVTADELARLNSRALLALNGEAKVEGVVDDIKGGPHAHGNLESLLNIAAGLTLCFIGVGALFKQLISWLFILGTLLHSGLLYLAIMFDQGWAWQVLGYGIGPIMLLVALLLTGLAAAIGFRGELVRDAG